MQKASEVLPWIIILLLGSIDCLVYEELTGSHLHSSKENGQLDTVGKHSIHKRYLLTEECFGERFRRGRCLYSYDCCGLPCIGVSIPKVLQSSLLDAYNAKIPVSQAARLCYTLKALRAADFPITNDYPDNAADCVNQMPIDIKSHLFTVEDSKIFDEKSGRFIGRSDQFASLWDDTPSYATAKNAAIEAKSDKGLFVNLGFCATDACRYEGDACGSDSICCDGLYCDSSPKKHPVCKTIDCISQQLPCYHDSECCSEKCSVNIENVRQSVQNFNQTTEYAAAIQSLLTKLRKIEIIPIEIFAAALDALKSEQKLLEAVHLLGTTLWISEIYPLYHAAFGFRQNVSDSSTAIRSLGRYTPHIDQTNPHHLLILDLATAAAPSIITGAIDPESSTVAFQHAILDRARYILKLANESANLAFYFISRDSMRTCAPVPHQTSVWAIIVGVLITIVGVIASVVIPGWIGVQMELAVYTTTAIFLATNSVSIVINTVTSVLSAIAVSAIDGNGKIGKSALGAFASAFGVFLDNGEPIG